MTQKLLAALRDVILLQHDFHVSNAVLMDEWSKGAITPSVVKGLKSAAANSRRSAATLKEILDETAPKAEASP